MPFHPLQSLARAGVDPTALLATALVFAPAAILLASTALNPQPQTAWHSHACTAAIVLFFAIFTPTSVYRCTRALGIRPGPANASAIAALLISAPALYLVLSTTTLLGGWTWVLASSFLLVTLHAANLAMHAIAATAAALASAASGPRARRPSRGPAGSSAVGRSASRSSC
jgi:hypothetical protein